MSFLLSTTWKSSLLVASYLELQWITKDSHVLLSASIHLGAILQTLSGSLEVLLT